MTGYPGHPDESGDGIALTARQYDEVPYGSFPFALLQPARIGATAVLYGFAPPDPATARVLEIGCASGGHIIPLAARFPQASFLGIDVSARQIAEGRRRVDHARLSNISLAERSVTELQATDGPFDYIICHGVFSWVSPAVREAILQRCAALLSPNGLATISFNVLPGWRLLQVIRDAAIAHAGRFASPSEKAFEIRSLFEALSRFTNERTTYGSVWRNELKRLTAQPDYYLHHELLESDNTPMTLTAFCLLASRAGLNYLGDAHILTAIPENAGPERASLIRVLGHNDFLASEQYTDIVTGRTFRHALLVREFQRRELDLTSNLPAVDRMHLTAPFDLKVEKDAQEGWWIRDGSDLGVQVSDEAVAAAVTDLIARTPSSACMDDLLPGDGPAATRQAVAEAIRKLVCMGLIDISLQPLDCPRWPVARPIAWPLARSDIALNLDYTTTQRHVAYKINDQARFLLPLADGTRTAADLADSLVRLAESGGVALSRAGAPVAGGQPLADAAREAVDKELRGFARAGLLCS